MKKYKLASKLITCILLILFSYSSLSSLTVFAASAAQHGSGTGVTNTTGNQDYLYLLYKNCQNLSDNGNGFNHPSCSQYQDTLVSSLGCSGNMFEEISVTASNGTVNKRWFINEFNYKDCLDKVGTALTQLNSQLCQNIQVNSEGWGPCADNPDSYQNVLRDSIGCSGNMYDKNQTTGVYALNFQRYQACQTTYNTLKGYHLTIVDKNGKPVKDTTAIGSFSGNGNNGNSPTNASTKTTCESGSFSLNWILCPVFNALSSVTDWFFTQVIEPELSTQPVCLNSNGNGCEGGANNVIYQAWSNFRIYGDVLLIIALIVIVYAETIGGGLVDAYTVRKVLPRLLAAAILVNLSIYIVAALVDITNVVGGTIGQIITAPLGSKAVFQITPGGISQATIFTGGFVGVALGASAIVTLFATMEGAILLLVGLVIPALLAVLAVFVTLILRKAIIIFLILVSPIAFALYCLPNTERYFRRWWKTLFEMLLIYPIVVLIFAIADIMSAITGQLNSNNPVNVILSFLLLIIPLFLIPFSFRLAGNTLSSIQGAVGQMRQQAQGLTKGWRAQASERYGDKRVQKTQDTYSKYNAAAGRYAGRGGATNRAIGRALRFAGRAQSGFAYNVEGEASKVRAKVAQAINEQINAGDDAEVRGLTVDKAHSTLDNGRMRINNGIRQYQSLGGAWIDESAVDAGQSRWGNNTFAQQAALSYEMRKGVEDGQTQKIVDNYHGLAQTWGNTPQQEAGTWIGAAFQNQDRAPDLKRTNPTNGTMSPGQREAFVSELYNTKDPYTLSRVSSRSISTLSHIYQDPSTSTELKNQIEGIATTLVQTGAGGGIMPRPDAEGNLQPDIVAPTGAVPGQTIRRVAGYGPAHSNEAIYELARVTGRLENDTTGQYPPGHDFADRPDMNRGEIDPRNRNQDVN